MSISAASVQDRDAAEDAVTSSMSKYPSLNTLFIDSAYAEKWAQRTQHKSTYREMTFRTKRFVHDSAITSGLVVMPKRWVVERTHAWNEQTRRLIMHHHRLFDVSAARVRLAETRMLARRLN